MFQTVSPGPPKIEALLLYMGLMSPEKIVDVITEHANEKILVLLWQGNFHLSEYLILRQPMFDFVYSSEPALPLLRENIIVPEAMVEAAFERPLGDLHHWINKIRARRPDIRRIIVAATPPPKGDEEFVRLRIQREFGLQRQEQLDTGSEYAVCAAVVRYKLWALFMRGYKKCAQSLDAEYLHIPVAAQDESGFLRPEFYEDDVTHANRRYGDLFLQHLQNYLQKTGDSDASSL
ncbi:MAG TPA: hypothetical protein VN715_12945 [Roseiarcus sp.]|nr:hypothetical protein [Roseiarcus sp.]